MSARNYRQCPQCSAKEKARREAAQSHAEKSYGKVSASEYAKLCNRAQPVNVPESLAEYFEIGVDVDGVFRMDYSCGCRTCGFDFATKHQERAVK